MVPECRCSPLPQRISQAPSIHATKFEMRVRDANNRAWETRSIHVNSRGGTFVVLRGSGFTPRGELSARSFVICSVALEVQFRGDNEHGWGPWSETVRVLK